MAGWVQLGDKEADKIKERTSSLFGLSRNCMEDWLFFIDKRGSIWLYTGNPRVLEGNMGRKGVYAVGFRALVRKGGEYRITDALGRFISRYAKKNKLDISKLTVTRLSGVVEVGDIADGEYIITWKQIPLGVSIVKKRHLIIELPERVIEPLVRKRV